MNMDPTLKRIAIEKVKLEEDLRILKEYQKSISHINLKKLDYLTLGKFRELQNDLEIKESQIDEKLRELALAADAVFCPWYFNL